MTGTRFGIFLTVVLGIWGVIHLYVFWRLATVPWVQAHCSHRTLVVSGLALWLSYVLARMLESWNLRAAAYALQFLASTWLGILFLLFATLLLADVVTFGGVALARWAPQIRGWAAGVALVLAGIALVQGLRAPVVTRHDVKLPSLPAQLNGTTLVAISDLHLGRLHGERWFRERLQQINRLNSDCIVVLGDAVDGAALQLDPLVSVLSQLQAPMGVWAVSGNHEFYEGLERSLRILEQAGWRVLRDESAEVVPGLVLAGVDDLTARQQFGKAASPMAKAIDPRADGAVILLSHSPMEAETAASLGAQLMLSGHTHGGQIWPFNYLVALKYPLVSGRYLVDGMTVIVGRGTGTWGPPMRLWQRGEILHLTLLSG